MISIVIPLYNKEHTIINTLNSVFKQTYQNFEIIIIDDGSTDDSIKIITQNFSDKRLNIIHQTNSGVSAARNRGVYKATNPYIAFLDADDEWLPTYLETMVLAITKYPNADMIGCASYNKDLPTGNVSANSLIDKFYNKITPINYFMNPDRMTHIGASVIKKESFIQAGGFDTTISINEDFLLQGKIAMNGLYIYIGNVLHIYIGGVKGQATSVKGKEKIRCKNQSSVINQLYSYYLETGAKNKLVVITLKYRIRHILLNLLKNNQYNLINIFINELSCELKKKLYLLPLAKTKSLRKIAILYIYATKIIWRLHCFPVVGQQSKYNKKFIEIYNHIR